MPKQGDDAELLEYIKFVKSIWIASTFPHTYVDDLLPVLTDAGFIVDSITIAYSGYPEIKWIGTCYDEDMIMYKFTATWTHNDELFLKAVLHYYELTDLDIEVMK
jgi:hypothetical protein